MPLPEWLIERGIGEVRYAILEAGEIVETRIGLEGIVPAGRVIDAQLIESGRAGRNAVAVAEGQEYLLPEAPKGIVQGARFDLVVTRERIAGNEPWKRPLGRIADATFAGNALPDQSDAI